MYRRLAGEPYHMPPREVDNLTMYQVNMLLAPDEEIEGVIKTGSESTAGAVRDHYERARAAAVENLIEGLPWHWK